MSRLFKLIAVGIVALFLIRRWKEARRATAAVGDVLPPSHADRESLADEASEGSFPASDPPSYWAREREP